MPAESHCMWKLDYLFNMCGTQIGVVGVVIFFVCSGFFIPLMQSKYNKPGTPHLLLSRIRRIYPTSFVSIAVIGVIVYSLQGMRYGIKDYLVTATATGSFFVYKSMTGAIWYLMVLFAIYLICSVVHEVKLNNLTYIYTILYLFIFLPKLVEDIPALW